jgi:hypothetical protein
MRPSWAGARDAILSLLGAGLVVHEVVVIPEPRLIVLTIAATLLGLPSSWATDRALARRRPSEPARASPPDDTTDP